MPRGFFNYDLYSYCLNCEPAKRFEKNTVKRCPDCGQLLRTKYRKAWQYKVKRRVIRMKGPVMGIMIAEKANRRIPSVAGVGVSSS